jgi:NADH:ubiquinone oxidoreductase subunit 2 (subunit N)
MTSFERPTIDWAALSPELILLGGAALCLIVALFLPWGWRRPFCAVVAAVSLVGAGAAAIVLFTMDEGTAEGIVSDALRRDRLAEFGQILIAGSGLLAVGVSFGWDRDERTRVGEYYALLLSAAAGMAFFVAASNLMTLFLGLEWFSISLYILCAVAVAHLPSLEAGLKYLIVGSFGSAILLFGSAFVYGATALILTMRLLVTAFPEEEELWTIALAVIACISLAWGNIAALVQTDIKRLLAYSSISHAGFLLMPIAVGTALGGRALLFYLVSYAAMSIGAFAIVAARERELARPVTFEGLGGLGWERPGLGLAMSLFMFGFIGLPPAGLFLGKFYAFSAAVDRGWAWFAIVGAIATVVSIYYYVGVVGAMYFRHPVEARVAPAGGSPPRDWALSTAVVGAVIVTVGSFFAAGPLLDIARDSVEFLGFPH